MLLDFGPVIGTNVAFFGEQLGCKLFIEDLVADLDRHTRAGTLDALPGVLETRFRHADASVDGVLCWDVFDFLDKAAAQALARQVVRMLRPGGAVMGFFCTAAKTDHVSFTKYEIVDAAISAIASIQASAARSEPCRTATSSGCSTAWSCPIRSCSRAIRARSCCGGDSARPSGEVAREDGGGARELIKQAGRRRKTPLWRSVCIDQCAGRDKRSRAATSRALGPQALLLSPASYLLYSVAMRPVIALLSDFGTRDHYAGTMKGVILGICPEVTLVDITHDVAAHDVLEGALQLAATYRYFPAGTIFLAVVDPGVGSARRGIAAEAGDYRFVAPDNGVLTEVLRETPPRRVVELTERRYARPTVSRTFEGRDRFAPAAAWLAKGTQLAALGRTVTDVHRLDIPIPEATATALRGVVLTVDRFGNLVTNIDRKTFEGFAKGEFRILAGGMPVGRLVSTYAEIPPGEVCALFGSSDHLELAANAVSAAEQLSLSRHAVVEISRD